jgi:proteic killer suppression protein
MKWAFGVIFLRLPDQGLEDFFYDEIKKGIQAIHAQKLADILDRLDTADDISDMKFPGSDLHPLKRKLKGRWAVKVSGNWRVVFRFEEGNAYESIISITIREVNR